MPHRGAAERSAPGWTLPHNADNIVLFGRFEHLGGLREVVAYSSLKDLASALLLKGDLLRLAAELPALAVEEVGIALVLLVICDVLHLGGLAAIRRAAGALDDAVELARVHEIIHKTGVRHLCGKTVVTGDVHELPVRMLGAQLAAEERLHGVIEREGILQLRELGVQEGLGSVAVGHDDRALPEALIENVRRLLEALRLRPAGAEDVRDAELLEGRGELLISKFLAIERLELAHDAAAEHGGDGRLALVTVIDDLVLMLLHEERARRADVHAAAAAETSVRHKAVLRADGAPLLGLHHAEDAHALRLADVDTAAALDALVSVAHHDAGALVDREIVLLRLKRELADAELAGQRLQLAEAVALAVTVEAVLAEPGIEILDARAAGAGAVMAVHLVLAEHLSEGRLAEIEELRAVGGDVHTLRDLDGAGELFLLVALHLHDAELAGGVGTHALIGAERGDADPGGLGRLENGRPGGDGNGFAVDGQIHIRHDIAPP